MDTPRIAAIIPAWRQPALLGEAIFSILRQDPVSRAVAIVVDDGCDFVETRETALCFARSYPERVFYLRQNNGGLSSARNAGINFALEAWPTLEAVMFLDADNRVSSEFLRRGLEALAAAPSTTGWLYPDIDMLGLAENWSMRGPFSLLLLLKTNFCDAGCVVRAELLRKGLRFDEALRQGFEDWDFWLQAAEAGFTGQHLPRAGFQYRRRGESMSIAASRQRGVITAQMNRKRSQLLRPSTLLAIEMREAPRFAILSAANLMVRLTSDPGLAGTQLPPDCFTTHIHSAREHPAVLHVPPFLCFASEACLSVLASVLLQPGIFWLLQRKLRDHRGLALFVQESTGYEVSLRQDHVAGVLPLGAACLIAVKTNDRDWEADLASGEGSQAEAPRDRWTSLILRLPQRELGGVEPGALALAQSFLCLLQAPRERVVPEDWRMDGRPPRNDLLTLYEAVAGVGPPLPIARPSPSLGNIGFLVPLHSFGGVEKVIANQAMVLRRLGYHPHLFVSGGDAFILTNETREAFCSVTPVICPAFDSAVGQYEYFGTAMSGLERHNPAGSMQDMVGLLAGMDVLINTHSLGGHGIAGHLRTLGVVTMAGLHLIEHSPDGAPEGNAHMILAYEQSYDRILVISRQLFTWALSFGIPEEKLLLLPNAPSYPDRSTVDELRQSRVMRAAGPLRVLFLGRLDWQKGVDRLAAIIAATRSQPIEWRVVGRRVVTGDRGGEVELRVPVAPPLHDPCLLDATYDWADVLVLPSRFEGVPLTLLEARRRGAIVVATQVGAIAEVLQNGDGGYLLDASGREEDVVARFVALLHRLTMDPALVTQQALLALAAPRQSWETSMQALLSVLPNSDTATGRSFDLG